MSNEGDVDKRVVSARVPLETCQKVAREFGRANDKGFGPAVVRALEEATRDVVLTPDDYEAIAKEVQKNIAARAAKRAKGTRS